MAVTRGRQIFQHPGPTNIPERVLRAIDRAPIDYTCDEFQATLNECQDGLRWIFKTRHAVVTYTASGHGAWEAALVNISSPGDKVLVIESGFFSRRWCGFAEGLGLETEVLASDWCAGADPDALEERLRNDKDYSIHAVMVVHNETSTGVTNRCADIRGAIDRAGHPALLLIDAISSLACIDVRMDEWQADVIVSGSQKGLMLPVGLSFTGVSAKALAASAAARMPRSYWDWRRLLTGTQQTSFHGTQPVNSFFGLREALKMIEEEGLEAVYARHHRLAEATRRAVDAWQQEGGPQNLATNPLTRSNSVTAILVPEGHDAEKVRQICLDRFNVSIAAGLAELKGRIFRIGHMGDLNEAMILGTIASTEASLEMAGVPYGRGGINAAMAYLCGEEEVGAEQVTGRGREHPATSTRNGAERTAS